MPTQRITKLSVTNFLHCDGKYLLLHRRPDAKIDPGKWNGIGGKVEAGEDFLTTAIRETEEETGYVVQPQDCRLTHLVHLTGGYADDWVMCFFAIRVPTLKIPVDANTREGQLEWLSPEEILNGSFDLVDDLNYLFRDVVEQKPVQFVAMEADALYRITILNRRCC